MSNVVATGAVACVEALQGVGEAYLQSSDSSSQSTPERREPDVDSAWDLNSVHVFQCQQKRVPIVIIKTQTTNQHRPVEDDAGKVATKGDQTLSSATSRTQTFPSVADEYDRITYVTDQEDEGTATRSKNCMAGSCISKLAPTWCRRGSARAPAERSQTNRGNSLKGLLGSKRAGAYESVEDVGDIPNGEGAGSTQCETEQSRTSNNVEGGNNSSQERYSSSHPYAHKYPDPISENRTWEEFDGGTRCWFQSCKRWPVQDDSPNLDLLSRHSSQEYRNEVSSTKLHSDNATAIRDSSVASQRHIFPRTTPFVVKENHPVTTVDETPLPVQKDGPTSPARSNHSSSSTISQASSIFVIQKNDYQLALKDRPIPAVATSPSFESIDDDSGVAFILEVGLD